MEKVYNFAAGPAVIDESVLKKAAGELVCYRDKGMSVMEMSHQDSHVHGDLQRDRRACARGALRAG